jgi:hypothetical protein
MSAVGRGGAGRRTDGTQESSLQLAQAYETTLAACLLTVAGHAAPLSKSEEYEKAEFEISTAKSSTRSLRDEMGRDEAALARTQDLSSGWRRSNESVLSPTKQSRAECR